MKKRLLAGVLALMIGCTAVATLLMGEQRAYAASAYSVVRIRLSTAETTSLDITVGDNYQIKEDVSIPLPAGAYTIRNTSGQMRITGNGLDRTIGATLTLERCQSSTANFITLYNTRYTENINYMGNLRFVANGDNVRAINDVPIEEYLYGVVGFEMSNSYPPQALRAQAIAARSYAIADAAGSSASAQYDLVDTSASQVYRGYPSGQANIKAAVDETRGMVLMHNGKVCMAYFSASNGGQTELPGNAWGGGAAKNNTYPYLPQADDPYDVQNTGSLSYRLYLPKLVRNTSLDPVPDVAAGAAYHVRIVNVNFDIGVYAGASTDSRIGTANKEQIFAYLGESGNYYKITFNGNTGYVNKAYSIKQLVTPLTTPSTAIPALPIEYTGYNPVLAELQQNAYTAMVARGDGVPHKNNIRIMEVLAVRNTALLFADPNSRCYMTAQADLIVQYVDGNGALVDNVAVSADIQLVTGPADSRYAHAYLDSSCRMRFFEPIGEGFDLVNRRYGHGVGLSQRGAQQRALTGQTYQQILGFYFAGATLTSVDTGAPDKPVKGAAATGQLVRITLSDPNSYVNVRSGPTTSASSLGKAKHGETYPYLGKTGTWWIIQYNGKTAYVSASYGTLVAGAVTPTPPPGQDAAGEPLPCVIAADATVRSGPGSSYSKIGSVVKGRVYGIYEQQNGYSRLLYGTQYGWVETRYITFTTATPTPPPAVNPTPTPAQAATGEPLPCVIAADATVRSGPGSSYSKIGTVVKGRVYGIYEQQNGYSRLWYGTKYGWVETRYITFTGNNTPSVPAPTPAQTVPQGEPLPCVIAADAVVRSGAGSSYAKIGSVVKGRVYGIYEQQNGYSRLLYGTRYGWVETRYITFTGNNTPSVPAPTPAQVIPAGEPAPCVIAANAVVRSGAGSSYSKIGSVVKGRVYGIYENKNGWSRLWYGTKYGWVETKYINFTGGQPATANGQTVQVKLSDASSRVNIRQGASMSAAVLGTARHGQTFTYQGKTGTWWIIDFQGQTGYLYSTYGTLQ